LDSGTLYDVVRTWFGTAGLILMVALFVAVLVYALRPSNKKTFDHLAELPLRDDEPGEHGKEADSGKTDTDTGA